jgi:hypothetical protein
MHPKGQKALFPHWNSKMKRLDHLSRSTLGTLASGSRTPSARESGHLAVCAGCSRRLADLRRIVAALRSLGAVHAPDGLVGSASESPDPAGRPEPVPARLLTQMHPGSHLEAPAGLRSAAPATRQWLFRAGPFDIDLQAFPEGPESRRILGQAFVRQEAGRALTVHLRHDRTPSVTSTDRHGEFRFTGVSGTAVRLLVETDDEVFELVLGALPEPGEPEG